MGRYDEWLSSRTMNDGSVLANGTQDPDGDETFNHTWEVMLNEIGKSFLKLIDYVAIEA